MSADPERDRRLRVRLGEILEGTAGSVAFVWPLKGEVDLRPLMRSVVERGRPVGLPVVAGQGRALAFRAWPDDRVMIDPDTILVPMLGFDRARNRLGRGGGFYDRTLAARTGALAIGFAAAAAELARVPVEAHDRPLASIVTEREVV